ncbi:hypothetical protein ElyMa_005063800 [Elysia marginata]|uniref:Uncharacterized protein n=1 Tax=Elysia marginata TaxID=1093978 RepID=A0AAV4JFZ6_9GAST|nr:hypothetical protein ElyMa_005063800 [Elysia marginata]
MDTTSFSQWCGFKRNGFFSDHSDKFYLGLLHAPKHSSFFVHVETSLAKPWNCMLGHSVSDGENQELGKGYLTKRFFNTGPLRHHHLSVPRVEFTKEQEVPKYLEGDVEDFYF